LTAQDLDHKILEESCQVFANQGLNRLDDIKALGHLLQDEKYLISLGVKLGAVLRVAKGVLDLGVPPIIYTNPADDRLKQRTKKRSLEHSGHEMSAKKESPMSPQSPMPAGVFGPVHTIAQCPKGSRGLVNNPRRYCGSCKGCPGTVEGKTVSKLTSHFCEQCKVPLHPQCFKIYHDWRDPKCKAGKHAPNPKILEIMDKQHRVSYFCLVYNSNFLCQTDPFFA
jgi:hypothetical protein